MISDMLGNMVSTVKSNRRTALLVLAIILILSVAFAVFRPRQYVASLIVTQVESSYTDPSSFMFNSPLSIRSAFNLVGPGAQMGAFLKLLKSPQVAMCVHANPQALSALESLKPGFVSRALDLFSDDTNEYSVGRILVWLTSNISTQQDPELRTWTLQVRHPKAEGAIRLLTTVHACAEDILRKSAIVQLRRQRAADYALLQAPIAEDRRKILYEIVASLERSLLVLQSGTSVATNVISQPYTSERPTEPSRAISFLVAFLGLSFAAVAAFVAWAIFRRIKS